LVGNSSWDGGIREDSSITLFNVEQAKTWDDINLLSLGVSFALLLTVEDAFVDELWQDDSFWAVLLVVLIAVVVEFNQALDHILWIETVKTGFGDTFIVATGVDGNEVFADGPSHAQELTVLFISGGPWESNTSLHVIWADESVVRAFEIFVEQIPVGFGKFTFSFPMFSVVESLNITVDVSVEVILGVGDETTIGFIEKVFRSDKFLEQQSLEEGGTRRGSNNGVVVDLDAVVEPDDWGGSGEDFSLTNVGGEISHTANSANTMGKFLEVGTGLP